ncbi:MAG: NUDIX domain-containing protein [Bacteroidia bacterium]|nr:MAG: NUDIX domain-containing protein [Bacteroidia bacterium]
MNPVITFSPPGYLPDHGIGYVIIGARYRGQWIFVYHNRRKSWGLPAGHIDGGENPDIAARRELEEETGALEFNIDCLSTYTVISENSIGSGRLYFAEVEKLGEIQDREEIGDIICSDNIPGGVAFPEVQEALFNHLVAAIGRPDPV